MTKPEILHTIVAGDSEGEPLIDIVAVHGLNPTRREDHAFHTWTAVDKDGNERLWLSQDLPKLLPRARIFLYEYNSFPALTESKQRFIHEGSKLLACLDNERYKLKDRPIIFIAHSLGGILVKQALVNARQNPLYEPIGEATQGLFFFGTPHGGGKDALVKVGTAAARVLGTVTFSYSNDIMKAVKSGSMYSDILKEGFRHQLLKYQIVSFVEGAGTNKLIIVDRDSATFGLPGDKENIVDLARNHSNLCRFDTTNAIDMASYKHVYGNMRRVFDGIMEKMSVNSQRIQDSSSLNAPSGVVPQQHCMSHPTSQ
ncbi:hypothetical protein GQ44DRAFT_718113 [Phaeosphaeriaceae sp. PMI808]|nr:hypothetical protein GQ44DRAFT_718113 [Phaeosphaeriaceae sp. PMI808]